MSDLPQKQRIIVQAADDSWRRDFEKGFDEASRTGTRIIQNLQATLSNMSFHDEQYSEMLLDVLASMAQGNPRQGLMRWKTKLAQHRQMVERHAKQYPGSFDDWR